MIDSNSDIKTGSFIDISHNSQVSEIIEKMIFSPEFKPTRDSYQCRNLGYGQLKPGELQLFNGLKPWADAILEVAENLPKAVKVVSQWKKSDSTSKVFAIWYK